MPKRAIDPEFPKINLPTFVGGEAIDLKNGIVGSCAYSLAMDFRQKASQMTVLPGMRTLASSIQLKDKITDMDQDIAGMRYGIGDQGYFYSIDSSNTISRLDKLNTNGAAGIVYNAQNDQLYISDQLTVSLFGQTQNNPQLRKGNFGPSASVAPGVIYTFNATTQSYDGGTSGGVSTIRNNLSSLTLTGVTPSNYTGLVTNTLSNNTVLQTVDSNGHPPESGGGFCSFIPDIEPFYGIAVYVTTIGSGDWTLWCHDSLNNNLGSVTITHANIQLGWNLFTFATPGIRAFINAIASVNGATGYHFHITSSVAADTAAVATISTNDLTGTNFVLFANRLVQTKNGWHPMTIFNGMLCIGNGNYLSVYNFGNDSNPNNAQWVRHQLLLDVGFEITSLTKTSQFLVMGAEKRSTNNSRNYQEGYIYTWDGIQAAPNKRIPVPMGAPYSLFTFNNNPYFYCGGSLFVWGGGDTVLKVRYISFQNSDYLGVADSTVINPNMMDARYNLLMLGYPSSTTNPNTFMGIYSWGAVELTYPNSFGKSYYLANGLMAASGTDSNGNAYTNLQIGMIKNFVDTLYTSWQYTDHNNVVHYGLDVTDSTSGPAPIAKYRVLIWDGAAIYKSKRGMRFMVSFLPLPANVTVTGVYNLDRTGEVTTDPGNGKPLTIGQGADTLLINVPSGRARELQWGFNIACAPGATTPTIIGITGEIDGLEEEQDLREYTPNE